MGFRFFKLTSLVLLLGLQSVAVRGGVFSQYRFVEPGQYAIGVEPILNLSSPAGTAINLRYTYGLSEVNNLSLLLGTGGAERRFRFGGNLSFDIFPDIDQQPGLGIGIQTLYINTGGQAQFEGKLIPYLHKTFVSGTSEFEPFLAFPFGLVADQETDYGVSHFVLGGMFKASDHFRYVVELGMAIANTESYVSSGIVYYP